MNERVTRALNRAGITGMGSGCLGVLGADFGLGAAAAAAATALRPVKTTAVQDGHPLFLLAHPDSRDRQHGLCGDARI